MKLYVSDGNPHGLKVLAAAGLWAGGVEIQRLQQEEKVVPFLSQAKLPALELTNGNYLFSANAICRYFLLAAGKDQDDLNNQWLEWEAAELQPVISAALYANIVQGKKKEETLATVGTQLGHISQSLAKKPYLTGDAVSVADIVGLGGHLSFSFRCVYSVGRPVFTKELV
ncbi:methionine--tRNA ligase, cytoplasmic-like [Bufo bufo]|uniref:methionine--tRNA ligase, cytoplasmic-like n=1 Tax=Bufo bufo TaxID=8384 RepID=UPI001ABE23D8|nr:methionine--tRNA ligase, cytoplasmic-like [Bufo bufo]